MAIKNNVVVFHKEKKKYGSVAEAIMRVSETGNFDIAYLTKGTKKYYRNAIVFENKIEDLNYLINRVRALKHGWWMGDYSLKKDSKYLHSLVSHIFLAVRSFVAPYSKRYKRPTHYMPLCGLDHETVKIRPVTWDVMFIGRYNNSSDHRERIPYIERLKKDFNFKLIHNEGHTRDRKYLYGNTPINISISKSEDGMTSNRLFDILASGGFCLVRYFPGLDEMFANGQHLVWFNSVKEMKGLVQYYLKNEQERKEIAKNGHNLYKKKHTAQHRIQNIFDIMNGKTEEFYGYRI